jgi:DNA repair exonuclease SbcCD ATPase subunit
MNTEIGDKMDAFLTDEDYQKQVLDRYEARQRSFIKQSTIFFIFVFSFLAFILIPIISLKLEAERITLELKGKPQKISELQKKDTAFRAEAAKLSEQRDLVNGKLTSLYFLQTQNEEKAEQAKVKLAELKGKLEQIQTDKGESEKHLALLKASEAEMGKVLGIFDVRKRVDELRSWFREKTARCHKIQECQDDWQSYYAGQVRTKLQADWDSDFQLLRRKIVDPLRTVEPEVAQTIAEQLTDVRGVFEANLDEDPRFWRTISEKEEFMDKLAVEWERAFAAIQSIVNQRSAEVQRDMLDLQSALARYTEDERNVETSLVTIQSEQAKLLNDLKATSAREQELRKRDEEIGHQASEVQEKLAKIESDLKILRKRQHEIQTEQTEIGARLSKFQSPFGTLPLGFKEAALAFPFILAAGFLVCALLLANLIRLRREYHELIGFNRSLDAKAVTDRVALVTPLWLDPAVRTWRNVAVAILLLLPIPIFALTAPLISSDWFLQLSTEATSRILPLFYDVLYFIGILLLGVGIWRVGKEWHSYRKKFGST